jgi:hypothetical protein
MAVTLRGTAGKLLYGALFCVALPLFLTAWARAANDIVHLPAYGSKALAISLISIGAALMIAGMAALWRIGGGLPMNAYPPPRFVAHGVYGLLPHPIYVGFSLLTGGFAMFSSSPAGLWLITPTVALGCAALVLGYERIDLAKRFGTASLRAIRWLPAHEPTAPSMRERMNCVLLVLLPWAGLYGIVSALGTSGGTIDLSLPIESRMPIVPWTEALYITPYLLAACAPFLAHTRHDLRVFSIRVWISTVLIFPIFVALPVVAPRPPFTPADFLGRLLAWERDSYSPIAAFPSFHVVWSIMIAELLAARAPRLRWVWRAWALSVAVSCLTTRMHSAADVLAGLAASLLVIRADQAWAALRRVTEWIANSWREWRLGPVRIINHGAYAGLASFLGVSIAGTLAGRDSTMALVITAVAGLVGAGLWAQFIEGSPRLLRPYGFYGGAAGVTAASLLARWFHADPWLIFASYCTAMPWIQGTGRIRCLVQGCCHGGPAPEPLGIRYRHPRSRVCRLSPFTDIPVHPTPLYSILWDGLIFLIVFRLWIASAPLPAIIGTSLILSGLGRFVEEAYRGEPQTAIFGGLRLYQWIALGTILAGAAVTSWGPDRAPALPQWNASIWLPALAFGWVTAFAMGVDFPGSHRRFARLT